MSQPTTILLPDDIDILLRSRIQQNWSYQLDEVGPYYFDYYNLLLVQNFYSLCQ